MVQAPRKPASPGQAKVVRSKDDFTTLVAA
jgi:hypothetical protein